MPTKSPVTLRSIHLATNNGSSRTFSPKDGYCLYKYKQEHDRCTQNCYSHPHPPRSTHIPEVQTI